MIVYACWRFEIGSLCLLGLGPYASSEVCVYIHLSVLCIYMCIYVCLRTCKYTCAYVYMYILCVWCWRSRIFFGCGYCATLQGSLGWFEVDLMCCCSVLQCVAVWFEVDLMCLPRILIHSDFFLSQNILCIVYLCYQEIQDWDRGPLLKCDFIYICLYLFIHMYTHTYICGLTCMYIRLCVYVYV